jgi:hypothetical protein
MTAQCPSGLFVGDAGDREIADRAVAHYCAKLRYVVTGAVEMPDQSPIVAFRRRVGVNTAQVGD